MATIVAGSTEWSATIRCAHPTAGAGLYRVDGCFSLIKIDLQDIAIKDDGDGYSWMEVACPACGQRLLPEWQIGRGVMDAVRRRTAAGL